MRTNCGGTPSLVPFAATMALLGSPVVRSDGDNDRSVRIDSDDNRDPAQIMREEEAEERGRVKETAEVIAVDVGKWCSFFFKPQILLSFPIFCLAMHMRLPVIGGKSLLFCIDNHLLTCETPQLSPPCQNQLHQNSWMPLPAIGCVKIVLSVMMTFSRLSQ